MRHFGPNKTALHFRRAKKRAAEGQDEANDPQKYRLEEGDGTAQAQLIVRELYLKYEKQLQRWKDYRNLFLFLGFVLHFLAILYLQRSADIAYKVHSTVESVVLPGDNVMQNTDDVYGWLKNLLTEVWKDPVCGDGLCEAPFEFASYSRFGCRADCGKLNEVQNLTSIQIDIYYDFSHLVGSIPASDLMQQASWNLCPVTTPYSNDCYFDTDVSFESLSGEQHYTLDDTPDGDWNLVVKRDIFDKVRGAVRDATLVNIAGYHYKIYIAAAASMAEQDFEIDLLTQAATIANMTFYDYANSTIKNGYPNATEYDAAYLWIRNSTCTCGIITNDTTTFGNNTMMLFLNQSRWPADKNSGMSYEEYRNDKYFCPEPGTIQPTVWKTSMVYGNWTKNLDFVFNISITDSNFPSLANDTKLRDWCRGGLNLSLSWRTNMTKSVQELLIERRLGDQKTTGKIAIRNNVSATLRKYIQAYYRELEAPVFTDPSGTVALQDPVSARLDYLMPLYVDGTLSPQPAFLNLSRRVVYDYSVHLLDLKPRAEARVVEVQSIRKGVEAFSIPVVRATYNATNYNYTFKNTTVGDVVTAFTAAKANTTFLPNPNDTSLRFQDLYLNTSYNLVSWAGNTSAYMRCNLADRAPDYVGECVAMENTCLSTVNDTMPYLCKRASDNSTIDGTISNQTYRIQCELPCDKRFDCNTICECFGTCLATEFCQCKACNDLGDATTDVQFLEIQSVAVNKTYIAPVTQSSPGRHRSVLAGGRRLTQTTNDNEVLTQLNNLVTSVGSLSDKQSAISDQMSALKAQVDQANDIAKGRANDKTLIDAINAGRKEIEDGQKAVEAKLDEILDKQNQALEASLKAQDALQKIKELATRQEAAVASLEQAVRNQLVAIQNAAFRDIISLSQALALWKRARRDRALTLKAAMLANLPCESNPVAPNTFKLDNHNVVDDKTSRERNVGLTNRVIAGLLLHQTRTNVTNCAKSKFEAIQRLCTGQLTTASYGVDPVFKRGTTSYNPDFDDGGSSESSQVVAFYNCSILSNNGIDATYNINNTATNQIVNPPPYCAELYNPQKLPYAFHHIQLEGKDNGFPVYFDINLSEEGAQAWYTYINEGLYLDQNTRQLTAELVTYNAQLRIFSYFYIRFYFSDGGSIKITHRLNTVRVELDSTYSDRVRFGFEIILSVMIFGMLLYNLWQIFAPHTAAERSEPLLRKLLGSGKRCLKYFLSGWHWVEFASNCLLTACMIIWWVFRQKYAKTFDIDIRYDVYDSLTPQANYLALSANGANLINANAAFSDLRELVDMLNWYFALNGINILLLIARVLKLMDFQPRLGVVTRSLWLAGPDLIHFAIVAGMVFVGYAMMAHLIFGNAIEAFATFGDSINTCFEILLGNIDVNDDLRALGGLQSVAGALFFWSYELLVFMVLLNFLLAIIVDAFSEVKEKTHETVGIHTELFTLLRDKWRSLMGACSPNYISDSKLGALLRQWGGGEDEDKDDNDNQADKRKLLTILNEDVDEDTLAEVLRECLRDAPPEDLKANRGFAARFFRRRQVATEEEIKLAAHYIMDRFGTVPDDDDEDYDDEENAGPEPPAPLPAAGGVAVGSVSSGGREVLEKERDQLAQALERLAEVQRELAEGQRNLMNGQKQLAEQQSKLVQLMNEQPPTGN
ncbi:hypothetical protein Vretimale_5865 [Volvox reticuliferus]|uniref:Polycystin cation channel PKD1/PKD2 domain-containing protein n=1 Tax=Volvox reticuliferus TaxID=1737510 RepID=A0A8J4G6H3_9CHLO|nr:hypothetical protein Vretifemale_5888 [Volvox reticuliferus]GIM00988.1 hypothetical protein Vretimale_5865 [Volvox reticuliferus]